MAVHSFARNSHKEAARVHLSTVSGYQCQATGSFGLAMQGTKKIAQMKRKVTNIQRLKFPGTA